MLWPFYEINPGYLISWKVAGGVVVSGFGRVDVSFLPGTVSWKVCGAATDEVLVLDAIATADTAMAAARNTFFML